MNVPLLGRTRYVARVGFILKKCGRGIAFLVEKMLCTGMQIGAEDVLID
jgi:hypothetical protein